MNLPTKLTFLRIFMIPAFVIAFFAPFTGNRFVALVIFALACFTDFLDGYLARKNNEVTTLGKFLDPIADKLLVACALIAVSLDLTDPGYLQIITAVCAMIILCREIMVSCFRIMASSKNVVLAADIFGKLKTVFQMVALIVLIPFASVAAINQSAGNVVYCIGFGLLAVATALTIFSGANYIVKNKDVLKDD